MNFKAIIKYFNFFDLVNFYRYDLSDIILTKKKKKHKALLTNSYKSDFLLKRFFKNSLKYDTIMENFFSKDLFAFSNKNVKIEIVNLLNKKSNFIETYLKKANDILGNRFTIFEKQYKFNSKIEWNYSFFKNYYWPRYLASDIEVHPNREIDVLYVWMFNRHYYLINLSLAYYLTGNEKYSKHFKYLIIDWINNNPPLYGINWYSALEISMRLVSWIFSLYFLKDSDEINNLSFFKIVFKSMFEHVYYLKQFYSRRSKNHTVGELFGICLFSSIFNSNRKIKFWKAKFFRLMRKQISLQTRLDGTNIEQSINYHRFVLEFFTLFLLLDPKNTNTFQRNTIEKMYEFLLNTIKPNQNYPHVGDSDEGNAFFLTDYSNNRFRELMNIGSLLFNRSDFKFLSEEYYPIFLLLFGTNNLKKFQKITGKEPKNNFALYRKAGYYVIRNNWSKSANYLFIDFGRFGAQNAGHSHSSVTNFIFSYQGKDIIIDSGTYSYNKSWKERNHFRSSRAHNVLAINQKNQAKPKSWFLWEQKPKVGRKVIFDNDRIVLIGCHDGYGGNIVSRKIITNKELNFLTIIDKVKNIQISSKRESLKIDLYFHFNSGLTLESEDNKILIDNEILLRISSNIRFKTKIEKTYYSPNYGIKCENQTLIVHLETSPDSDRNVEIKTEICPINQQ